MDEKIKFNETGYFFDLENKDKKVFGKLKYNNKDGGEFTLYYNNNNSFEKLNITDEIKYFFSSTGKCFIIVFPYLYKSKETNLLNKNNFIQQENFKFENFFLIEDNVFLENDFLKNIENDIENIKISFNFLGNFLNFKKFKINFKLKEISLNENEVKRFDLENNMNIIFEEILEKLQENINEYNNLKLEKKINLIISDNKDNFYEIFKKFIKIKNFFSLILGTYFFVEFVEFEKKINNEDIKIKYFFKQENFKIFNLKKSKILININDIENNHFENWINLYKNEEKSLYISILFNIFQRRNLEYYSIKEIEYFDYCDLINILSKIDNDIFLKNNTNNNNKKKENFEKIKKFLNLFKIDNKTEFEDITKKIKDIRNNYTHYNKNNGNYKFLINSYIFCYFLIYYYLLLEIGFEKTFILKKIKFLLEDKYFNTICFFKSKK